MKPEDIKAALEKATDNVRNFAEKTNEKVGEFGIRLQEVEQAIAIQGNRSTGIVADDEAERPSATLRDQHGNPVGVLLAAKDLRSQNRMRASLSTLSPRDQVEPMGLTEFVRGVAGMRTTQAVQNALAEGTNATGGYAVPSIMLPGILGALAPASSLLQAGANVAVLDTQADSFKIAAVDTLPTAAWREEAGNLAESDPTFRGITITPQSLAFLFKVSRELLQDAPGMEQALTVAIAAAFGKALDRSALYGSGVAPMPQGLKFATGINTIADVGALTNYTKFVNAMRLIKESDAPAPTAAIVSTREDETIANFHDTTNQPLRRPDALANWQFIANSQMLDDGDSSDSDGLTDAFVGDFSLFTFYMRESVSIQLLNEKYADTGQIGFACHVRADCAPAYAKAFAMLKGISGP
ncbi:phage major capsid protein [Rhodanobacter lindaniclasticus]